MDLRERIVAHVSAGGSRRGAARQFGVSDSCSVKLLARVERTGSAAPARQGRPTGGGKLAGHLDFLIASVERHAGRSGRPARGPCDGRRSRCRPPAPGLRG
ncbi:hypothetical protein [Phenylobacterium sp. J367]|uniref:hypothetical protein n=1 Tax=Phenylobacterium sp. J367 TaxID=2898435 RepID=UPI0035B293EB